VISLVDADSGELIRQIPPEELLGISEKLTNLRGSLLDTTT
jgi:flagellar protein FlaG